MYYTNTKMTRHPHGFLHGVVLFASTDNKPTFVCSWGLWHADINWSKIWIQSYFFQMASQVALVVKNSLANAGECKRCRFNPWVRKAWQPTLEEGMTTHSSILAWRIPRTEKPGGLQSIGSQRRYSSKASILWHSAFFMIQLTSVHDYWKKHTIVSKVMSFSVC